MITWFASCICLTVIGSRTDILETLSVCKLDVLPSLVSNGIPAHALFFVPFCDTLTASSLINATDDYHFDVPCPNSEVLISWLLVLILIRLNWWALSTFTPYAAHPLLSMMICAFTFSCQAVMNEWAFDYSNLYWILLMNMLVPTSSSINIILRWPGYPLHHTQTLRDQMNVWLLLPMPLERLYFLHPGVQQDSRLSCFTSFSLIPIVVVSKPCYVAIFKRPSRILNGDSLIQQMYLLILGWNIFLLESSFDLPTDLLCSWSSLSAVVFFRITMMSIACIHIWLMHCRSNDPCLYLPGSWYHIAMFFYKQ